MLAVGKALRFSSFLTEFHEGANKPVVLGEHYYKSDVLKEKDTDFFDYNSVLPERISEGSYNKAFKASMFFGKCVNSDTKTNTRRFRTKIKIDRAGVDNKDVKGLSSLTVTGHSTWEFSNYRWSDQNTYVHNLDNSTWPTYAENNGLPCPVPLTPLNRKGVSKSWGENSKSRNIRIGNDKNPVFFSFSDTMCHPATDYARIRHLRPQVLNAIASETDLNYFRGYVLAYNSRPAIIPVGTNIANEDQAKHMIRNRYHFHLGNPYRSTFMQRMVGMRQGTDLNNSTPIMQAQEAYVRADLFDDYWFDDNNFYRMFNGGLYPQENEIDPIYLQCANKISQYLIPSSSYTDTNGYFNAIKGSNAPTGRDSMYVGKKFMSKSYSDFVSSGKYSDIRLYWDLASIDERTFGADPLPYLNCRYYGGYQLPLPYSFSAMTNDSRRFDQAPEIIKYLKAVHHNEQAENGLQTQNASKRYPNDHPIHSYISANFLSFGSKVGVGQASKETIKGEMFGRSWTNEKQYPNGYEVNKTNVGSAYKNKLYCYPLADYDNCEYTTYAVTVGKNNFLNNLLTTNGNLFGESKNESDYGNLASNLDIQNYSDDKSEGIDLFSKDIVSSRATLPVKSKTAGKATLSGNPVYLKGKPNHLKSQDAKNDTVDINQSQYASGFSKSDYSAIGYNAGTDFCPVKKYVNMVTGEEFDSPAEGRKAVDGFGSNPYFHRLAGLGFEDHSFFKYKKSPKQEYENTVTPEIDVFLKKSPVTGAEIPSDKQAILKSSDVGAWTEQIYANKGVNLRSLYPKTDINVTSDIVDDYDFRTREYSIVVYPEYDSEEYLLNSSLLDFSHVTETQSKNTYTNDSEALKPSYCYMDWLGLGSNPTAYVVSLINHFRYFSLNSNNIGSSPPLDTAWVSAHNSQAPKSLVSTASDDRSIIYSDVRTTPFRLNAYGQGDSRVTSDSINLSLEGISDRIFGDDTIVGELPLVSQDTFEVAKGYEFCLVRDNRQYDFYMMPAVNSVASTMINRMYESSMVWSHFLITASSGKYVNTISYAYYSDKVPPNRPVQDVTMSTSDNVIFVDGIRWGNYLSRSYGSATATLGMNTSFFFDFGILRPSENTYSYYPDIFSGTGNWRAQSGGQNDGGFYTPNQSDLRAFRDHDAFMDGVRAENNVSADTYHPRIKTEFIQREIDNKNAINVIDAEYGDDASETEYLTPEPSGSGIEGELVESWQAEEVKHYPVSFTYQGRLNTGIYGLYAMEYPSAKKRTTAFHVVLSKYLLKRNLLSEPKMISYVGAKKVRYDASSSHAELTEDINADTNGNVIVGIPNVFEASFPSGDITLLDPSVESVAIQYNEGDGSDKLKLSFSEGFTGGVVSDTSDACVVSFLVTLKQADSQNTLLNDNTEVYADLEY